MFLFKGDCPNRNVPGVASFELEVLISSYKYSTCLVTDFNVEQTVFNCVFIRPIKTRIISNKIYCQLNTTKLFILLQHFALNLGPPACLDDNTAYYGYNIRIFRINGDSSTCQQSCQRRNGCNFWSFYKGGKCFLKTSKAGEPGPTGIYGPVYPGNNHNYVSGSKYCTHVSNTY